MKTHHSSINGRVVEEPWKGWGWMRYGDTMICARIFNCNLKEKRKWATWKETKHSHSKCHGRRSVATTGKGWWWVRGDWRLIGGDMGDYLCGGGKSRMQFKFSRVSKNLNKNKGTHRIKHSRWSAATTGKGWWWARGDWSVIGGDMGDYLHGGGKSRIQFKFLRVSKNSNKNKGTHRIKCSRRSMATIGKRW